MYFCIMKMQKKLLIGAKLKKIREKKGYSQNKIANLLGISQKTYSNIESDKSKVSIEQLAEISKILDFDLFDFLQEQGLVINQSHFDFKDNSNNALYISNMPDKMQQLYEAQIQQLKEMVQLLKEQLEFYKNRN